MTSHICESRTETDRSDYSKDGLLSSPCVQTVCSFWEQKALTSLDLEGND